MSKVKDFFPAPNISYTPYMIGSVIMVPHSLTPSGFVLCDGRSLSRTTYSVLYSLIGVKYGSANSSSFNVPNYRGMFLRGRDNGGGYDPNISSRTLNPGNTGTKVGSIQEQEILSHQHAYWLDNNDPHTEGYADLNPPGGNPPTGRSNEDQSLPSGGVETRPKNYSLVFRIKAI